MKEINGFYWPDHDEHCHAVIHRQINGLERTLSYVKNKRVCIQAGGNVGVWPKRLAQDFEAVYTFEPDPENFNCLARNLPEHNIYKFNAALSNSHELITVKAPVKEEENNCGAYQVFKTGFTPALRIDDFVLPYLDLIYLDIEGYEYFAIQGGLRNIRKHKPVIALEDKKLPIMYGLEVGDTAAFLCKEYDYDIVERVNRDVILAPK